MIELHCAQPYDEGVAHLGVLSAKHTALQHWRDRKEARAFAQLCRRLSWRKYAKKRWQSLSSSARTKIIAYRKAWALAHKQRVLECQRKSHRKARSDPAYRQKENAQKRAHRAKLRDQRRAETVYTCKWCGGQWSPVGRIPSRPPKWCGLSCRGKAAYARKKASK